MRRLGPKQEPTSRPKNNPFPFVRFQRSKPEKMPQLFSDATDNLFGGGPSIRDCVAMKSLRIISILVFLLAATALAATAHAACPQRADNLDTITRCIAASGGMRVGQVSGQMDRDHRALMYAMQSQETMPPQVMPYAPISNINPWLYVAGGWAAYGYNPWMWTSYQYFRMHQ